MGKLVGVTISTIILLPILLVLQHFLDLSILAHSFIALAMGAILWLILRPKESRKGILLSISIILSSVSLMLYTLIGFILRTLGADSDFDSIANVFPEQNIWLIIIYFVGLNFASLLMTIVTKIKNE